jgi:hypothetical protein
MDGGKIILARLAQGAIGEENSHLLGTLIVSKLHQLALSRQDLAAAERRPFYLYMDEFQNFVTPSMEGILSGARKYRLGLVLAHQDLRQIQSRSPEVLHSILTNPYCRVCFRVGDHDAKTLADGFVHFDARDLQSLGTGEAIARVERAEFDFNLRTAPLPPIAGDAGESVREQVIRSSRAAFARPRAEVEELLRQGAEEFAAAPQPSVIPPPASRPVTRSVAEAQPAAAPTAPTVPATVEPATEVSLPGRGGRQHKYLQELIRRWADANDWRATLEERILDGLGLVDVALRKGDMILACEISVSTSPEHELDNLQKCLSAGFRRIAVIGVEKRTLTRLQTLAADALTPEQAAGVGYYSPEELFDALDALEAETHASQQTVRGYRVKVRAGPSAREQGTKRRGLVSAVIAGALKRMKKKT